jgi:hypothetical protein
MNKKIGTYLTLKIVIHLKNNIMKINQYRIRKSWECYVSGRKNGRNVYWSIRLSLWWFSGGFNFEGDKV